MTSRVDKALQAIDEQGTKFTIFDSPQSIDAYLLQSPSEVTAQQKLSIKETNIENITPSSSSEGALNVQGNLKMEFNMWMFQQNQASFAALTTAPPPPVPPPSKEPLRSNTSSKSKSKQTEHTSSSKKRPELLSEPKPSPSVSSFVVPPPNGMMPPPPPNGMIFTPGNLELHPPPGFEAISLVLPPPPSFNNIFQPPKPTESKTPSLSSEVTIASSKYSESTSSSSRYGRSRSPPSKLREANSTSHQAKRSDREFKHIRRSVGRDEDGSSDGECSPDEQPIKSRKRGRKSSRGEEDSQRSRSNGGAAESRKRKIMARERSCSGSRESKTKKESKKSRRESKKKKSEKKKSKAAKILVTEVDDVVGCCDGIEKEYEEEVSVSDSQGEDEYSSISGSPFCSSVDKDSEGEISTDEEQYQQSRSRYTSAVSSHERYAVKRGSYSASFSRSTIKSNHHHNRSESDGRQRLDDKYSQNEKMSRRYSRRKSPSPNEESPRGDRRRVRREDNEKLEDSLQQFRQRKGMSRYSQQQSISPGSSRYNNSNSRFSAPPFNSFNSSQSFSNSFSSIFSNRGQKSAKDDESTKDDEDDGNKNPLAGDDVSPMDRARIDNYLKSCQQRYSYGSCGQIAYYDSHCHIDFLFKKTGYKKTYKEFRKVVPFPENYGGCVAVFCEPHAFSRFSIVEKVLEEENLVACFGCHPHSSNMYNNQLEANIRRMMTHPKVRAWGECGLDYSDRSRGVDKEIQQYVFRRQLKCAVELKKPLCVHSRQSDEDLFDILREEVPPDWKIHRHCYTESPKMALKMIEYFPNMYIGFTNVLTYPNATDAIATACAIPLDRILLETDAPYFLPAGAPKSMKNSNPSMAIQAKG